MRVFAAAALVLVASCLAPAVMAQESGCPLSFTATPSDPGTVGFHWSGFGGAEGYQVFGRQGQGNTFGASAMLGPSSRDAGINNLAPGQYVFWVDAFHSGTVVAESCMRTVQVGPTLAQACVQNLSATFQPPSSAFVQWSRVDGATGYDVARAVDNGDLQHGYAQAGQANHPSFTDLAAAPGHSYRYVVTSHNTREPPEACQGVTIAPTSVPFFPTDAALLMGVGGIALASLLLRRRR